MSNIETERLILRPWREDDAKALYKYACDPRIGPPAGWAVHESEEDSLSVLRNVLMKVDTWAVTLKGSDEAVGSIGFFPCSAERTGGEPEIGYWIGVPFWGRGYIPEAVKELISLCFQRGNRQVWCGHIIGNEKSKRVIEKCGFSYRFTEPWQGAGMDTPLDTIYYSLSVEDWAHE